MNKLLVAVLLLALSTVSRAEIQFVHWSLTLHEIVGPHPGADFHGSFTSEWPPHFAEEAFETTGRPPNVWTVGPLCCDIVLEGVPYGDSHKSEFMILQPTFDHDMLFDSIAALCCYAPDLWFGLPRLPDGSADPTPYFQTADGSISGLYEIHRVSEPSIIGLLVVGLALLAWWRRL